MSSNNIFGITVVFVIFIILAVLYYVMVYNPKISVQQNVSRESTLPGEESVRMMEAASSARKSVKSPVSAKVEYSDDEGSSVEHFSNQRSKNSSYPKDQLSAEDLLPQDQSSLWASVNPSGQGSLKDRNFLQSAYHIGINTVGQTLRNANLQLRSEPPNPQVKVSPWLQSTIEPDVSRKPFEIGAC
jgi:Na+-transporting methylmalonyl-CoA/oxaloacetate decarboxylase gamma subunit